MSNLLKVDGNLDNGEKTFLDLLRSGKEMDLELIIGDVDMPASFVWDDRSIITEYGVEKFKPIMDAKYKELSDGTIEIFCDDDELGEQFCLAAAGYVGNAEFKKLFGPGIL